jgi:hypothetical protein
MLVLQQYPRSATFTALIDDLRDNDLAAGGTMGYPSAGSTVPFYVTSASISSGAVIILYL